MEQQQVISDKLKPYTVEIRMSPELHRQFTDMLFEASYRVEELCRNCNSEGKYDNLLNETLNKAEKKLVDIGLQHIGKRLEMGQGKYIKFNIKIEYLLNILNMKE